MTARIVLTAGLLLAVGACSKDAPPTNATVTTTEATAGGQSPTAANTADESKELDPELASTAPVLKLLEAGKGDKSPLRYDIAAGKKEELELQFVINIDGWLENVEMEGGTAPLTLKVNVGPTEKLEDDSVRYSMSVDDVVAELPKSLSDEDKKQLLQTLEPLKRMRGTYVRNARGLTQRMAVIVPGQVSPRLRTFLGNVRTALVSVPFPEEAVGKGARWEVTRNLDVSGVKVAQTVTYTLSERKGNLGKLEVAVKSSAPPQELGEVEPGVTAKLQAYEGTAVGSIVLDTKRLVPASEVDGTTKVRMSFIKDGTEVPFAYELNAAAGVIPSDAKTSKGKSKDKS